MDRQDDDNQGIPGDEPQATAAEHAAEEAALAEEQAKLRAEIERSSQVIEELQAELAGVDDEIRTFANDGPRYEALARLCVSLEELDSAGAAELFWEGTRDQTAERLAGARQRIDRFEADLGALKERRQQLAERVGGQNLVLEALDYDLDAAIEEEEERRAEWLVERDESALPFRRQVMPWARGFEEDNRFVRALAATVLVCLVGGLIIQVVDLPILERERRIEVPERVARLVQEIRRPPPAEVVEPVVPEEPEPEEPEEPEPVLADEPVPELSEEPAPQVAATEEPESTREQVKSKGILAFRESFASRADARTGARLGSQARVSSAGEQAVGRPTRSMVTSNAPGSSGGINLASISRDVGGGGGDLAGVRVTQAASSIGGSGTVDRPRAGGPSAGRTDEEIQIVFDRYKAALYRLYNRELRKDPTLRGQVVLKLTIEPDGTVSFCTLASSDMDAPTLAQLIIDRVSNFDFGAKEDILAMTIIYPIDFLPSA